MVDLFYLFVWLTGAVILGARARAKNRSVAGWVSFYVALGLVCFLWGVASAGSSIVPFVVSLLPLAVLLALPAQGRADERACPSCAEMVKVAAVKCRFCGAELTA